MKNCLKIALFIAAIMISISAHAKKYRITMQTTQGDIELRVFDATPLHTKNFIQKAQEGFYDSLLFHRVIKDFMIQGGDPDSKNAASNVPLGAGGTGDRIPAEFRDTILHYKGRLAAARDNNPTKASSNCQFYIVVGKKYSDAELNQMEVRNNKKYTAEQRKMYKEVGGTPHLDGTYTVFGEVTKGLDVVDKICAVAKDAADRPKEDQRILKIKVKKKFLFFWI